MTDWRNDISKQGVRGLRNNNPGNVKQGGATPWNGQVGTDNLGHAIFDSVENGLRALTIDLVNKQRLHNLYTLQDIFEYYAPTSDGNNPTEYAQTVASGLGIGPSEHFVINSGNIAPLIRQVITVELGRYAQSYVTDDMIQAGVQAAPGKITAWLAANKGTALGLFFFGVGILYYLYKQKRL